MTNVKSDYLIVFDGGSIGNPGRGYGSYAVTDRAGQRTVTRLDFPGRVTSNEAEYDTLLAALQALAAMLEEKGQPPGAVSVDVRGDSQLVIFQLTGRWKAREPRMSERRERVLALARKFKRVSYTHHPRSESMKILGH